jgi:hypothetical protein
MNNSLLLSGPVLPRAVRSSECNWKTDDPKAEVSDYGANLEPQPSPTVASSQTLLHEQGFANLTTRLADHQPCQTGQPEPRLFGE